MMARLPDHVDLERIRHRLEGISESERPVVTADVEDGRTLLAKQGGRPTRVNYVGCT